ncbi:MAG TPA: MTH1187 family thiamine-binding protein [Chloroflexia bacterium]|nr:MTH1187 family thiamine-binding protein [Chloroflexia bacterium]
MKVIAEVTFSPLGTGTPSLSRYVAAALAVLPTRPDVTYQLNPMGTVLEGERAAILAAVEAMNEAIFQAGALRVGTTLKIDERRDKATSMQHKVDTVVDQLRRDPPGR